MKKGLICLFCLFISLPVFHINVQANEDFPTLRSHNAIVIHRNDDRVMYEKNSDEKIYPASMTKIMTTLVAIENIKDIKQTYTFKNDFFITLQEQNASVAGFENGQVLTMEDLLYGILLPSGADATLAIADALFGSEAKFVEKMNEKSVALNLNNTHFVNTSGLHDEKHYSTVKDIAKLLTYALQNETFKTIFTTDRYTTSDGQLTLYSTLATQEHLLSQDTSMIQGAKTGFTNEASLCLASLAQEGEEQYIMVSAQSNSNSSYPYHIEDAAKIYEYLFDQYERKIVAKKGDTLKKLKLSSQEDKKYSVKSTKDISVLMKKGSTLKVKWDGLTEIETPEYSDTFLGSYLVYEDDQLISSQDYYLEYNLEASTSLSDGGNLIAFIKENSFFLICIITFGASFFFSYNRTKKK